MSSQIEKPEEPSGPVGWSTPIDPCVSQGLSLTKSTSCKFCTRYFYWVLRNALTRQAPAYYCSSPPTTPLNEFSQRAELLPPRIGISDSTLSALQSRRFRLKLPTSP